MSGAVVQAQSTLCLGGLVDGPLENGALTARHGNPRVAVVARERVRVGIPMHLRPALVAREIDAPLLEGDLRLAPIGGVDQCRDG